jgi:purine catabolism regulator
MKGMDRIAPLRDGISVAEALALPALSRGRLVAGAAGLERRIRSVNMMEVPDIGAYLRPGELLVTTAYPLRDDTAALVALVPLLAGRELAGLGLKPGRYIKALPKQMVAAANRLDFPLIELPDDASFNDILADVLGSILNRQALQLERSRAIHDRLTGVVLAGGSFPELIEALASLVGHPAAVLDGHGEPLATSGNQPAAGASRTARAIQAGHLHHGEVVVWAAESELGPDGTNALEHAATIAALEIAQSRALLVREQRHRALLLEELVSGQPLNHEEVAERAAAYGWNLALPRVSMVAGLRDAGGEARPVAGQALEEGLLATVRSVLGPSAIGWGRRFGVAVLAETGRSGPGAGQEAAQRLAEAVKRANPGLHVAIGIGRRVTTPDELCLSHREAVQALNLGRDLHGPDFVLGHDELGVYRLLQVLAERGDLARFCAETLGPLLDYDASHSTSLVRTLEVYLEHDGNMASAARRLYVHYNTLRYRLDQISTLTGGLDRHPTSRLALNVAVHGLKLLRSRSA